MFLLKKTNNDYNKSGLKMYQEMLGFMHPSLKIEKKCVKSSFHFACPMVHVIFKYEIIKATLQKNSKDQFEQSHWQNKLVFKLMYKPISQTLYIP